LKTIPFAVLIAFGFVLVALVGPTACTQPDETRRVLVAEGYTQIEITGRRSSGEHATFATGFRAKSPKGAVVTGTVTSGLMKGPTIRIDGPGTRAQK
jgi:hypothetical protein